MVWKESGRASRLEIVADLMLDRRWHKTVEIESVSVGGSQGTRRLRELRKKGWAIEKRKVKNSTQYEYRFVG